MKIKKIKLINFKKFDSLYEFDFQDNNLITGANGSGKSSIKDAILFCFYNRTSEGSLSESTRYISSDKLKSLVEIVFEVNGQEHTIRRERTDRQTRITYRDNSQVEEDSQITQETLESMIPLYKDFSAVFNIGWFMMLNDREKRDYMLNLTPDISKGELFEKLGGTKDDIEKFSLSFEDIIRTHNILLKVKRENEEVIEALRIFNRDSIPVEIPKLTIVDKSEELEKLKKENEKIIHYTYKLKEYENIKKYNEKVEVNNKDLQKKIAEIKIEDLNLPSQDKINTLITKKNELSKQIKLPIGTCPTCFQIIPAQHRVNIKEINAKNIELLEETEKLLQTEQRQYEDLLKKWQENEEKKKIKLMYESQFSDSLPKIKKPEKVNEVNQEISNSLEENQKKLIEEKRDIVTLTNQEEIRLKKIEKNKERILVLTKENERLIILINIFSPQGIPAEEMNIKLDPIKKTFQTLLPNSDIITIESLKNEMGYKEVFKIIVEGKEYSKLSLGEKTRVDIAISQIINSMLKEKIDVFFLDNSEVLDSSISLPKQSFICKVNNQQLKIN